MNFNNSLNYIKSQDGKKLYIYGTLKSKGIYKLDIDNPEKPELLAKFPREEDGIAFGFDILDDNKILFSGTYNDETGIFLYDIAKSSTIKLVSGGQSEEGEWCPDYNVSPDKTKLLYGFPGSTPNKSHVYIAKLSDGKLLSKLCLLENADLQTIVSLASFWGREDNIIIYQSNEMNRFTLSSN